MIKHLLPTTPGGPRLILFPTLRKMGFLVVAGLSLLATVPGFAQQTVKLTANPIRFTVPISTSGSVTSTVTVTIGGTTDPVDLLMTGLPPGVSAVLNSNSFTASGSATLTLNYTSVPEGQYDMALVATSAVSTASYRLDLPVYAAYQWSAAAANGQYADAGNWIGGAVPGAGSLVAFSQAGANAAANVATIKVAGNTEVSAIRLVHGSGQYHTFDIAAGTTLAVTGDGGYYNLRDQLPAASLANVCAQGAGTMVVSNANATFAALVDGGDNQRNIMDFDQLNTLVLDVNRIAFNDYLAYPKWGTNGNTTNPRRWPPSVYLAKTNAFRATLTDANNWTNVVRNYSFVFNRSASGGGSGSDFIFYLGFMNSFNLDSMLICGAGMQADAGANQQRVQFNNTLTGSPKSLALRGANGGRMSNLTLADAATPNGVQGSGTKVIVDLTAGAIDGLVDKLLLSRNATNVNGANVEANLMIAAGTLDVNEAVLGYQQGTNLTATGVGYCRGTINLTGGTLIVNSNAVFGYTEEVAGTSFQAENGFGQLNVTGPGVAYINTVTVGGPSLATLNNTSQRISLTGGGRLIVSNVIGAASTRLNTLTMNNSVLGLHVNGATTDPYVYVTTLTTGGTSNVLKLATVTGLTTFPARLALISYTGSAAPNYSLELPTGLYGYVENNAGANTIDAVITTNPPANLVWNGNLDGNWDSSTPNWQGSKVFADGDTVTFDDTAAGTTSVMVAGTVTPGSGGVLITNAAKNYSLASGSISGTAQMTKTGSGNLTMDATSALPLTISAGSVDGSGTVGFTTVAAGSTLNYSGTINGLASAGTSASSGTINIGLSVSGGSFDHSGTANGTFATTGGSVTNRGGSTVNATGTSTVGTGSTLVQEGQFNNKTARLAVAGNLTGSGTVSDLTGDTAGNNGRLEINGGGVFTPGGAGVIGSFLIEGRFDLNAATPDGKLVIDVDLNHPQKNDILYVDKWSNFRGALNMNNIGTLPFAVGQSFMIYSNNFGFPNVPEAAFDLTNKITPVVPGVGLKWDTSNLKTNGIIAVIPVPTTPPTMTLTNSGGTNLTFAWPASHIGYQLHVQTNSLSVGLAQNWSPIAGSEYTNRWNVLIDRTAPAVFYRLSNQ
jgi:hypothetical protein